jgi:hypothetical protein
MVALFGGGPRLPFAKFTNVLSMPVFVPRLCWGCFFLAHQDSRGSQVFPVQSKNCHSTGVNGMEFAAPFSLHKNRLDRQNRVKPVPDTLAKSLTPQTNSRSATITNRLLYRLSYVGLLI